MTSTAQNTSDSFNSKYFFAQLFSFVGIITTFKNENIFFMLSIVIIGIIVILYIKHIDKQIEVIDKYIQKLIDNGNVGMFKRGRGLDKTNYEAKSPESHKKSVWRFIGKGIVGGFIGGSIGGFVGGFEYAQYMNDIGAYYFHAGESFIVTYFISISLGLFITMMGGIVVGAGIGFGFGRADMKSKFIDKSIWILIGTLLGGLVSTIAWVMGFIICTQFTGPWVPISHVLHGITAALVGMILILGVNGVKEGWKHYILFFIEAMALGVLAYFIVSKINTSLAIFVDFSEVTSMIEYALRITGLNLVIYLTFGICIIIISSHRKKEYYGRDM